MCAHFHYIALELQFFNVTLPEIHVHLTHAMCCDIIILMVLSLIQDCWWKQFFFATYRTKVTGEATLAKLQGQQRQKRNMICMAKARQKRADDCFAHCQCQYTASTLFSPWCSLKYTLHILMMSCNFQHWLFHMFYVAESSVCMFVCVWAIQSKKQFPKVFCLSFWLALCGLWSNKVLRTAGSSCTAWEVSKSSQFATPGLC